MKKTKSIVLLSIVAVLAAVFTVGCANPMSTTGPAATVLFHANGGSGTMDPLVYGRSAKMNLPQNKFMPPEGMVFGGWSYSPYGDIIYEDEAEFTLKDSAELYAMWKPSYSVDNYAETDVFEIYSPAQLLQIAEIAATKDSRGRYSYGFSDPDGSNKKTIRLMRDINMASVKDFRGIGANAENTSDYIFSGILDGNGKTIKHLNVIYEGSGPGFAGLITNALGAEVKDLGIESGRIANDASALVAAGSIFGNADSVVIRNVWNNADVHSETPMAGGLVGQLTGQSLIENSYNSGSVTVGSGPVASAAGGLAGVYGSTAPVSQKAEIRNSYNTGTVTNDSPSVESVTGGIVGAHVSGNITNTYNVGTITGSAPNRNGIAVHTGTSYPMVRGNFTLIPGADDPNAIPLSASEFASGDIFAEWTQTANWEISAKRLPPVNGVSRRPVLRGVGEGK